MHTFIDEAGRAIPSEKKPVTCVAALVIPDSQMEDVNRWFLGIEREYGELIKGRKLPQALRNRILEELSNFDVFVESTAIDMDLHPVEATLEHQKKRASFIESTPPTTNPFLLEMRSAFANKIRATSNQLYLQANLTWLLVELVLRHGTIYYSQKRPEELGAFHWIIDPKQAGQITDFEKLWTGLVLPYLQCKPPLTSIIGHDYSYLDRFAVSGADIESYRTDSGQKLTKEDFPLDLKKVMMEDLRFPDDQNTPGLRLVDVIANTIFRCLNGSGDLVEHKHLGRLFFLRRESSCVSLLALHESLGRERGARPYFKTLQSIEKTNRPIWVS